MNLIIESKVRLPFGLVPSPDYTQIALAQIVADWTAYLAGDMSKMFSGIMVRPDEGEAWQTGNEDQIGQGRLVEFRDIRSILIMA